MNYSGREENKSGNEKTLTNSVQEGEIFVPFQNVVDLGYHKHVAHYQYLMSFYSRLLDIEKQKHKLIIKLKNSITDMHDNLKFKIISNQNENMFQQKEHLLRNLELLEEEKNKAMELVAQEIGYLEPDMTNHSTFLSFGDDVSIPNEVVVPAPHNESQNNVSKRSFNEAQFVSMRPNEQPQFIPTGPHNESQNTVPKRLYDQPQFVPIRPYEQPQFIPTGLHNESQNTVRKRLYDQLKFIPIKPYEQPHFAPMRPYEEPQFITTGSLNETQNTVPKRLYDNEPQFVPMRQYEQPQFTPQSEKNPSTFVSLDNAEVSIGQHNVSQNTVPKRLNDEHPFDSTRSFNESQSTVPSKILHSKESYYKGKWPQSQFDPTVPLQPQIINPTRLQESQITDAQKNRQYEELNPTQNNNNNTSVMDQFEILKKKIERLKLTIVENL